MSSPASQNSAGASANPPSKQQSQPSASTTTTITTTTAASGHHCAKQQTGQTQPALQQQQKKQEEKQQHPPSYLLEDLHADDALKRQVEGQLIDLESQEDRLLSPRPAVPHSRQSGQANGSNIGRSVENDQEAQQDSNAGRRPDRAYISVNAYHEIAPPEGGGSNDDDNEFYDDGADNDDNDEMVQIIGEAELLLEEADIRRIAAAAAAIDRPEGADGEDVDEGQGEEEEDEEADDDEDDESSSSELELTIHGSPAEVAAVAAIAASDQVAAAVHAATTVAFPPWLPAQHHHQHHHQQQYQQADGQRQRRRRPGQAPVFSAYLSGSTYAAAGEDHVLGLAASSLGRLFARGWQRRLFRRLWWPANCAPRGVGPATGGQGGGCHKHHTSDHQSARRQRSHSADNLFTACSTARETKRYSTASLPCDSAKPQPDKPRRSTVICDKRSSSQVEYDIDASPTAANQSREENNEGEEDQGEETVVCVQSEFFDGRLANEHRLAVVSSNGVISGSSRAETAPGIETVCDGERHSANFRVARRCMEVHSDSSALYR